MTDLDRPRYFNALAELVGGVDNLIGGLTDGPISEIEFVDGVSKPTELAVQTKLVELQAEYDAQEYTRNRKIEYPLMADQLDYIFHNGVDKWKEDIVQPVKDKYPKPE
jgi:hypothetical protein